MNALSQEFGVSRMQVSRFIASAEEMGFLVRSEDERSVRFTQVFSDRYVVYFCHLYLRWMAAREAAETMLAEHAARR